VAVVILCHSQGFAQDTDEQLAQQYFDKGEFDKAVELYEKLFNKSPNTNYYNGYTACLLELKDFKTAEKFIKKQIKRNPQNLTLIADLGTVYKKQGDEDKAKKEYDRAIDNLMPSQEQVMDLASSFMGKKETDYAIKTYLHGRKLLRGNYSFNYELAEAYNLKGDSEGMINEYLDLLEQSDAYLQNVQNALQTDINEDNGGKKTDLLKSQLLKRIQSDPEKTVYSDMLIWLFTQEKDFESAFIQTKALDKRQKLDGGKLMALAKICLANQDYDAAVKCYEYVITKGKENYYYSTAKTELVNTLSAKITSKANYSKEDIQMLEKSYLTTIEELGKSQATVPLIKGLAHLKAFYMNQPEQAILLLEEAINLCNNQKEIAECKLELGDILLFTGEMWDSSLLFSQVEKAFKQEPIGQEAKFRNARLSFYRGDFAWAQAQLNVLKASTSKLISNDAIDLALLISDNTTLDSNLVPLQMYARADLLSYRNLDSLALLTLDSIEKKFSSHSLADDVLYKKYMIAFKKGHFEQAATLLQSIIDNHGQDVLGDDALFKLAELNEQYLKNPEKAKQLYEDVLTKYPGSLYTVEARKRYRQLRGDSLN
jgi:tetratricopeptide (TPR) repeat protein